MKTPLLFIQLGSLGVDRWLVWLLLSGLPLLATAQCPTGDVILSTQAQIDAFPPGCTSLNGTLTISGPDITNLNGLKNLQTVEGAFEVLNNPKLIGIDGLNALTNAGGDYNSVKINNNGALTSVNGLKNLQSVASNLEIQNNPQLTSLDGLNALTSVGSNVKLNSNGLASINGLNNLQTVGLGLEIQDNPKLTSLDGLNAINSIGRSVYISNNGALISVNGFTKLQQVSGVFEIQANPKLTSVEGLTALTSVGRSLRLTDDGLTSLQGLSKLQTVGAGGSGTFEILNNPQLTNINALTDLTSVSNSLKINNNGALTSIQGLNKLQTVGALEIQNNPKLAICAQGSICQLIADKQIAARNVVGNAPGCSSVQDIQADCMPLVIISQPPSTLAVCVGASVTAMVSTSGNARTFQWYQDGSPLVSQTSATLSLTNVQTGQSGTYRLVVSNSVSSLTTTAFTLTVNAPPTVSITPSTQTICQGQLTTFTAKGASNYTWRSGQTTASISVSVAGPYSVTGTANGCSATATAELTVTPLPDAPGLVTASGQPYPAGQGNLSISQNVGPVSLSVLGCSGGLLIANGNAASSFTISTAMTGTQTYTATCTSNGCTSLAGSFQLTVVPTTLSVLHRDADYGNTDNNIIKPFLQLANAGGRAIPYGEVTVRYWLTAEGQAPPANLAVYYAQLGAVGMKYVPLPQPRQGAFGYVEYNFPGGGSLEAGGNSGPIENGIQKTDGSIFDESDDYSYQANYADYIPNARITAYRNGVIFWGQEPTGVSSQTVVQVYSAAKDSPTTSQIQTRVELRNTGNVALPLSSFKLRYYFTSDNGQLANVYVDYADIGADNAAAKVVQISPVNGADSYVEITFPGSSLLINPRSSLGAVDFRILRSDNGLFDQTNDYSYAPNYGNVGLNNRVTAYLNNNLVFGTLPSGTAARIAASEPVTALSVQVLGNPVPDSQAKVEIQGTQGQPVILRLVDLQGRAVHEQRIEQPGEVERVSVPLGQNQGVLLLKVSTPTQQQQAKLLRP